MQLHPNQGERAAFFAAQSLIAGFIGLDFGPDIGDLTRVKEDQLKPKNRDFWAFAHTMRVGDKVLIIVHHFPFARVTVAGDYNYTREPVPEIGVWFRHFRRIDKEDIRFYGDFVTNANEWEPLTMTDTISPLRDPASASFRLIEHWR